MSNWGPTREEVPPDTRPTALLVRGIRRGALFVFLPVFALGQLLAGLTYVATGWYHLWSWCKIGLAESLTSVRVAFDATVVSADGATVDQLVVATGALTVAVLVLAFRAGREQGRGLEARPSAAAVAGSAVGLGFGVPAFIATLPVTLGFPRFGIDRLEPVRWESLLLPLVVAGGAGAIGGLSRARERMTEGSGARIWAAIEGGALALWWGLVLSFVGVLLVAALSPGPVGSYARFVDDAGAGGVATVVEHALLIPDQSVLVLATSMGATTTLRIGPNGAVDLTRAGVVANGSAGEFVAAIVGSPDLELARFPWWFAGFLLVPLAATSIGGRKAGADAPSIGERLIRGAAAGIVYAGLCVIAVWAASITVPTWGIGRFGSIAIGASPLVAGALAVAWGVLGGSVGATIPWPAALSAGPARPR
jgi:hypothetical protein